MTKNEALIEKAVAGAMGKEVIIREIRGKIVVSDKPEFKKRILSEKQELVTETMEGANNYAKWHMKDEQLRNAAQIRLNVTRERLYTALVSEYWKTHWEKNRIKLEEEREKEKLKKLENQNKANLDTTIPTEVTKLDMESENKNPNPDAI